VLQTHDEIVIAMPRRANPKKNPKGSNLWRAKEIQRVMESCGDAIGIPTPVGVSYHPENYADEITIS